MNKTRNPENLSRGLLFIGVFIGLFVFVSLLLNLPTIVNAYPVQPYVTENTSMELITDDSSVSCRYGVSTIRSSEVAYLSELRAGWFVDFNVRFNDTTPDAFEYVPTVRLQQLGDSYEIKGPPLNDEPNGLGPIIDAHPGSLWLIGNEVDRVEVQDPTDPQIYATAYYDIYHFIKDRDSTAQVANSALVQVTPGRLQYLDIVWDTYLELYGTAMPVDVWNMHLYVLPEARINQDTGEREPNDLANIAIGTDINLAKLQSYGETDEERQAKCSLDDFYCFAEHDDMDVFAEQVVAMRQWMKTHGQQTKPLIITEYSQLYPYDDSDGFLQDEFGNSFTPERVSTFMVNSFDYLETATSASLGLPWDDNKLIQQWLWFTMLDDNPIASSSLVDRNTGLFTLMGETYKSEVAKRPFAVNLLPENDSIGYVVFNETETDIGIAIRNNGNIVASSAFTVTFYADENLTQVIDTVAIPEGLGGCARHQAEATVTWAGLQPGVNEFWAYIDKAGDIDEDKSDNLVHGVILVDPLQTFLPIVVKN